MNLPALAPTYYAPASSLHEPTPQSSTPSQAGQINRAPAVEVFPTPRRDATPSTFRLRSYLPSAYDAQRHPARRKGSYA